MHKKVVYNYKLLDETNVWSYRYGVFLGLICYHALKRFSVAIIEKDKMSKGATIQKFGQVVHLNGLQYHGRESLVIL
jgi:hypothetical protein